jgi:hypothetical protein
LCQEPAGRSARPPKVPAPLLLNFKRNACAHAQKERKFNFIKNRISKQNKNLFFNLFLLEIEADDEASSLSFSSSSTAEVAHPQ